jgi:hypothetical protein
MTKELTEAEVSRNAKMKKWRKENKLSKPIANILLEAWRRVHQFNDSDYYASTVLFTPSEVKPLTKKGLLIPKGGKETKGTSNWYRLDDDCIKLIMPLEDIIEIEESTFYSIYKGDITF